jgi:hypothetical protein
VAYTSTASILNPQNPKIMKPKPFNSSLPLHHELGKDAIISISRMRDFGKKFTGIYIFIKKKN